MTSGDRSPLFVVGMRAEARLLSGAWRVAIGPAGLAAALADRAPGVLVSFGLCGALDPDLAAGDLVIGDAVGAGPARWSAEPALAARLALALPGARRGLIAASETIAATAQDKAALRRAAGALAVDMELHHVARAAQSRGLPFAVVRAVSDVAAADLPRSAQAGFRRDGSTDVLAVMRALAARPREVSALLRVAGDAGRGLAALRACAARLADSRVFA